MPYRFIRLRTHTARIKPYVSLATLARQPRTRIDRHRKNEVFDSCPRASTGSFREAEKHQPQANTTRFPRPEKCPRGPVVFPERAKWPVS